MMAFQVLFLFTSKMHLRIANPEWIRFNYKLNYHEDSGSSIRVIWKTFIVVMMIICLHGFSDEE